MKNFEMKLNELKRSWDNDLINSIIDDILSIEENDRIGYMEDVVNYGCSSGIVAHLIYRVDIVNYYNMFDSEIDEYIDNLIENGCIEEGRVKEVNSYYDEEREKEVYYYIDEYQDMIEIEEEESENIDMENIEFKVWCTYECIINDILSVFEYEED